MNWFLLAWFAVFTFGFGLAAADLIETDSRGWAAFWAVANGLMGLFVLVYL